MRQWQTEWTYCTHTHAEHAERGGRERERVSECKEERASTQTNTHNNKCWIWSNHVVYLNVEIWDTLNFVCGRNFCCFLCSFSLLSLPFHPLSLSTLSYILFPLHFFCCWLYYFVRVYLPFTQIECFLSLFISTCLVLWIRIRNMEKSSIFLRH